MMAATILLLPLGVIENVTQLTAAVVSANVPLGVAGQMSSEAIWRTKKLWVDRPFTRHQSRHGV